MSDLCARCHHPKAEHQPMMSFGTGANIGACSLAFYNPSTHESDRCGCGAFVPITNDPIPAPVRGPTLIKWRGSLADLAHDIKQLDGVGPTDVRRLIVELAGGTHALCELVKPWLPPKPISGLIESPSPRCAVCGPFADNAPYDSTPRCSRCGAAQRPDWPIYFMRLAYAIASRASCPRRQVGAIIVRDRDKRIVGAGYNGAPRGMPDCLEHGCKIVNMNGRDSCVRTIHAESNAIDDIGGVLAESHTMYSTTVPCYPCALRIIQSGIRTVIYHEYYESQGTKDVEALFATKPPGSSPYLVVSSSTVNMRKLDVPMPYVKASYT